MTAERVHALLDFYHAVQRLGQVAALRKDWSAKARTRWRTQQRHLLLQGEVEQVIAAVRVICRGRNSKAIRTHRHYFIKNQSRMAYAKLMAMKMPIGSGAIESTVRRVVNLRLKGPSIFWCRASAEAILLLRSYYKPTVSPLMIPLVYCHINSFQRASSVEKPWPGGEKRRDGRASHHVEW